MFGSVMTGGTAVALAAALLSSGTVTEERPPPGSVAIEMRTGSGWLCGGSVTSVAVAPDNSGFTTSYEGFPVRVGVGSKPGDARKNCQLTVDVRIPRDFTYVITGTEHTGYARLAKGATGQLTVGHYLQGAPGRSSRTYRFTGPYNDAWLASDFGDIGIIEYPPCGEQRLLTLTTELQVDAGTSDPATTTSELGLNDTGSNAIARYRLAWKRCPAV
ncbi:DUF4360 domain-containing protein [Streptomyces sp. UNOB3_S3]|uniref:DUF4360 domain-containing protein n=1 Tax=Streptomyces sp. UNOB3_S3 TaxID=2871682 RepID=UPI001E45DB53|nr:DUF4360 domain-containing protein [Streptomyces sp. UNOB3_S3]MCC3773357.1 DUF4360 domain-containing protein [Streptomyces sp. UNOB3_S3]